MVRLAAEPAPLRPGPGRRRPRATGAAGKSSSGSFGPSSRRWARCSTIVRQLIVAGAAPLMPLFRELSAHSGLHAEFVEGAVDDVGTEQLHERTLPDARRALDARDEALVAEFRGQLDRGLAADILTRVAEAAVLGRVRRLLVADGTPLFGRVDRTTGEVTLHAGQMGPQDDDVLDDLAEIVLARGGEVIVLDPRKMPDEAAAAATFRW